ncbi:MAG TPA: hypothetical protein VG273_23055 [Bryobacteraceae bacterium]|nr:hypothetical protein [Bryobacteraceae bacterium]
MRHFPIKGIAPLAVFFLAFTAGATSIPKLTFEELTDKSELVVSGQITRSWADWDTSHHFIWTHYEVAVGSVYKGVARSTIEIAEPGGTADGLRQTIADTVQYGVGEKVFLFLQRMPNGYLRTTGWSQGKYTMDAGGRVHAGASLASASRPIDGITSSELSARVAARIQQSKVTGAIR